MIKNYAYLVGAELASKLVTFAAIVFLARVVGPEAYGYFEFATAAMFCAVLVVDQGLGSYGAREIAKDPARTHELLWQVAGLRELLALIAFVALFAFAVGVSHPQPVTQLLLIYAVTVLGIPLLLPWVFQGHDQMGIVAVLQILRQSVFALIVFVFVRRSVDVWVVGVAEGISVVVGVVFGLVMYRRHFGIFTQARRLFTLRILRESMPIGLSQLFWVTRMYGATLVLGLIALPADVGYFAASERILAAAHTFVYLYFFNLLPAFARTWQLHDTNFDGLMARSLRRVAWACVLLGSVWVLTAPALIQGMYGAAFSPAIPVLQCLGGVLIFAWLGGHYRFGLIASGHQNAELATQIVGTLFALSLLPWLHARMGIVGAALALALAEIIVWAFAWALARQRLSIREHAQILVRPAVAAIIAGLVVWATQAAPLWERLSASTSVIVVCLWLFDRAERREVLGLVQTGSIWIQARLERRVRGAASQ